jgi:hypothetical protein
VFFEQEEVEEVEGREGIQPKAEEKQEKGVRGERFRTAVLQAKYRVQNYPSVKAEWEVGNAEYC